MSISVIILLIILGFILVMIEILVIPGITVAGIGGVLLIAGGIISGYYYYSVPAGHYIFLGSAVGLAILFFLMLKLRTWKYFGLKSEISGKVGTLEEGKLQVGDTGETVSRLAPIGKALIKDELYEVRTEGPYLDARKTIKIIRIDGNKIYVELK